MESIIVTKLINYIETDNHSGHKSMLTLLLNFEILRTTAPCHPNSSQC